MSHEDSADIDAREITKAVIEQYEAVRRTGTTNMIDRGKVYAAARSRGFINLCHLMLLDDSDNTHYYANIQRNYAHYLNKFGVR